jgi:hypothetical protein
MKQNNSYPDPLATNEEKNSLDYGLSYAKFVADQWFNGGIISDGCAYAQRATWIRDRRLYARGKQDPQRYKDMVAREAEQLNFLNLDWRPTNHMGKFVRVVANGTDESNFGINVSAMDRQAGSEREAMKRTLQKNMLAMPLLEEAKQLLGIDVTPQGFVPKDEEELKMFLEIKHRPKCEIAEEIMLNYIFKTNNWHNTKEKINEDLTVAGIGVAKVRTDKRNGILPEYIDPEFFIHSYVREKDFRDMKYCGHIEPTTIGNLKRNTGFTDDVLREIAKTYTAGSNPATGLVDLSKTPLSALTDMKVNVLHFSFETTKCTVYKKKKTKYGELYVERDANYRPRKRSEYERIDDAYNTWYEGSYVIGTNHIYDYKEVENMLSDESDKALCDYIVRASDLYENELTSFVSDVEPLLDQMHLTLLKLQHLTAEIRPNGANIDIDMLASLEGKVKGQKMTWQEILGLFQAKGITFSTRKNMGADGMKDGQAVSPVRNGIPDNLPHLLEILRDQYNRIREITGINPYRDGTQGERALVGIQQLAFLQSNVATSHIVNASLDITKVTAERCSSRITDIFASKQLKKLYERAVGKENLEVVEALKDRHLHDFGFQIQLKPTIEAVQKLSEDLSISLSEGSITVDIKMEAEELAQINVKLAREYLKYARSKRIKEIQEERSIDFQNKSQSDAAAAMSAEQAKVQSASILAQIEAAKYRELAKVDVMKAQQLNEVNINVLERKYQHEIEKENVRAEIAKEKVEYMEGEKMKRQSKNNTDHSKMIEQRRDDSGAIDFSTESFADVLKSIMNQAQPQTDPEQNETEPDPNMQVV